MCSHLLTSLMRNNHRLIVTRAQSLCRLGHTVAVPPSINGLGICHARAKPGHRKLKWKQGRGQWDLSTGGTRCWWLWQPALVLSHTARVPSR